MPRAVTLTFWIVVFLSDNGPNPWYSEEYPGNRGSKWFAQFDNSIENDPGETHNLAKDQPEKLKQLKAAWDLYAKDVGVVLS